VEKNPVIPAKPLMRYRACPALSFKNTSPNIKISKITFKREIGLKGLSKWLKNTAVFAMVKVTVQAPGTGGFVHTASMT